MNKAFPVQRTCGAMFSIHLRLMRVLAEEEKNERNRKMHIFEISPL